MLIAQLSDPHVAPDHPRKIGTLRQAVAHLMKLPMRPDMPTGLKVMDSIGLDGTQALHAVIARHPQVERIVAGHTHMALVQRFAGTVVTSAPALDAALLPDLAPPEQLTAQLQPPAYLLHHDTPQTGLSTLFSSVTDAPWQTLHDGYRWAG